MRNQQEINQAITILHAKGDEVSLLQADILKNARTEVWVFNTYVTGMPEDERNETLFFAARDASRFAAGKLALEEMIPDAENYYNLPIEKPDEEGYIRISNKEYQFMQNQLKYMVSMLEKLLKQRTSKIKRQKE